MCNNIFLNAIYHKSMGGATLSQGLLLMCGGSFNPNKEYNI